MACGCKKSNKTSKSVKGTPSNKYSYGGKLKSCNKQKKVS